MKDPNLIYSEGVSQQAATRRALAQASLGSLGKMGGGSERSSLHGSWCPWSLDLASPGFGGKG